MRALPALLALLLALPAAGAETGEFFNGEWDASILKVLGPVEIRAAGSDKWVEPKSGTPVQKGDEIRVGKSGYAEIRFGTSSVARLLPDSQATIADLRPDRSEIFLLKGTWLQKLHKLSKLKNLLNRELRWKVRTPTVAAAVRGTEFGVHVASDNARASVGVFQEGEVSVSSIQTPEAEKSLGPNQEASADSQGTLGESGPLEILKSHAAQMRAMRKRLAWIKRRFRTLPLKKRRELRKRLYE